MSTFHEILQLDFEWELADNPEFAIQSNFHDARYASRPILSLTHYIYLLMY